MRVPTSVKLPLQNHKPEKRHYPLKTSNPSRGADLTGSGRGVVDAILISKAPNSSIFLARPLFVRLLLRLLFELSGISGRHLAKIR